MQELCGTPEADSLAFGIIKGHCLPYSMYGVNFNVTKLDSNGVGVIKLYNNISNAPTTLMCGPRDIMEIENFKLNGCIQDGDLNIYQVTQGAPRDYPKGTLVTEYYDETCENLLGYWQILSGQEVGGITYTCTNGQPSLKWCNQYDPSFPCSMLRHNDHCIKGSANYIESSTTFCV
eukprot:gene9749-11385_t